MTDFPERIRVSPTHRPSSPYDLWVHEPPYDGRGTEYVRADLYEALRARVAALEKALGLYASLKNWTMNGPCDPNGPNFIGEEHASAALARIRAITGGVDE